MDRFLIVIVILSIYISGCNEQYSGYISADSISKNGFARDAKSIDKFKGKEIKIWGYVDYLNIYANGADEILGGWKGGNGPTPTTWRFNLKANPDDEVGNSFEIEICDEIGRDKLLKIFMAAAQADKPTIVFLKGVLSTFDAPMNFTTSKGIKIKVNSTKNILLRYPQPDTKRLQ
jgi:hypothetical protein